MMAHSISDVGMKIYFITVYYVLGVLCSKFMWISYCLLSMFICTWIDCLTDVGCFYLSNITVTVSDTVYCYLQFSTRMINFQCVFEIIGGVLVQ